MIFPKSRGHAPEAESDGLQLPEQALCSTLILNAAIVKDPPGFVWVPLLFLFRTAKLFLFNSNYRGRWRKTNRKERFIFLKICSKITFNSMSMGQICYFYFITLKLDKYLQLAKIMSRKPENLVLGFSLENVSLQLIYSLCIQHPILLSTRQPVRHKNTLRTAVAELVVCARTSPTGLGLLCQNHQIPS